MWPFQFYRVIPQGQPTLGRRSWNQGPPSHPERESWIMPLLRGSSQLASGWQQLFVSPLSRAVGPLSNHLRGWNEGDPNHIYTKLDDPPSKPNNHLNIRRQWIIKICQGLRNKNNGVRFTRCSKCLLHARPTRFFRVIVGLWRNSQIILWIWKVLSLFRWPCQECMQSADSVVELLTTVQAIQNSQRMNKTIWNLKLKVAAWTYYTKKQC